MKLFRTLLCLGFIAGLCACGAKSADDVKQAAQNTLKANGNPAIDKATYASACVNSIFPDVGAIKFLRTKTIYELSDLAFTKKQVYYTDGDCNNEAVIVTETGKVALQGTAQKDQPAQEDFNFEKTTVKVQTDALVKAFNLFKICGFDNNQWAVNVEEDVSTESSQATCPGRPSPRSAQELVLVKDGNLYLGADSNQAQRPDKVDFSKPYGKQQ